MKTAIEHVALRTPFKCKGAQVGMTTYASSAGEYRIELDGDIFSIYRRGEMVGEVPMSNVTGYIREPAAAKPVRAATR